MRDRWRVAVIDSGLSGCADICPTASMRFVDDGTAVAREPVIADPSGHGTSVARTICTGTGAPELIIGQVLGSRSVTTAAAVAAAIRWAIQQEVDLIHMSLGLRENRAVLAEAVSCAVRSGCLVVSSAPARGPVSFPARYPGVIRATADARCTAEEISALGTVQADFGACPRPPGVATPGGASIGAANLSRFLIERLSPGMDSSSVRARLGAMASHRGAERRNITPGPDPVARRAPNAAAPAQSNPK